MPPPFPSPFSPFHPSSLPKCPGGFFFPLLRCGLRFADEMRGSLCVLFKIETACRSVNIHFKVEPHVSPLFRKHPRSNYLFWSDKDLKLAVVNLAKPSSSSSSPSSSLLQEPSTARGKKGEAVLCSLVIMGCLDNDDD